MTLQLVRSICTILIFHIQPLFGGIICCRLSAAARAAAESGNKRGSFPLIWRRDLCLSAVTRCSTLTDQHRASRSVSGCLLLGVSPCVKVGVKIFTHFYPLGDRTRTARRCDLETSYSHGGDSKYARVASWRLLSSLGLFNFLLYVSFSVCLVTNPLEISHRCAFLSSQNPHAGAAAPLCLKEARNGFVGEKLSAIVCSFSRSPFALTLLVIPFSLSYLFPPLHLSKLLYLSFYFIGTPQTWSTWQDCRFEIPLRSFSWYRGKKCRWVMIEASARIVKYKEGENIIFWDNIPFVLLKKDDLSALLQLPCVHDSV